MTTIAVKRAGGVTTMAGDGLVCTGGRIDQDDAVKVSMFKGGGLLGVAGAVALCILARNHFEGLAADQGVKWPEIIAKGKDFGKQESRFFAQVDQLEL